MSILTTDHNHGNGMFDTGIPVGTMVTGRPTLDDVRDEFKVEAAGSANIVIIRTDEMDSLSSAARQVASNAVEEYQEHRWDQYGPNGTGAYTAREYEHEVLNVDTLPGTVFVLLIDDEGNTQGGGRLLRRGVHENHKLDFETDPFVGMVDAVLSRAGLDGQKLDTSEVGGIAFRKGLSADLQTAGLQTQKTLTALAVELAGEYDGPNIGVSRTASGNILPVIVNLKTGEDKGKINSLIVQGNERNPLNVGEDQVYVAIYSSDPGVMEAIKEIRSKGELAGYNCDSPKGLSTKLRAARRSKEKDPTVAGEAALPVNRVEPHTPTTDAEIPSHALEALPGKTETHEQRKAAAAKTQEEPVGEHTRRLTKSTDSQDKGTGPDSTTGKRKFSTTVEPGNRIRVPAQRHEEDVNVRPRHDRRQDDRPSIMR